MPIKGSLSKFYVKSTNAAAVAGDEVDGIRQVGFAPKRNLLDVTDFKDTEECMRRLAGLKDSTVTVSGDFEPADAPQLLIRTSCDNGSDIWATFLPNGTAGYKVQMLVESYNVDSQKDGKAEFSATFQGNGAPVAV